MLTEESNISWTPCAFCIKTEIWSGKTCSSCISFSPSGPLSRTPTNFPPPPKKKVPIIWPNSSVNTTTFSPFQDALHTKAGPVPSPPIYHLSGEKLSRKGIYLLDTGHVSTRSCLIRYKECFSFAKCSQRCMEKNKLQSIEFLWWMTNTRNSIFWNTTCSEKCANVAVNICILFHIYYLSFCTGLLYLGWAWRAHRCYSSVFQRA